MTPRKASLIATVGALIVRTLVATLRFRVDDQAGVTGPGEKPRLVWIFWHNRLFVVPHLFNHYITHRAGAALTSASKDGEILAAFLKKFNIGAVRGSSSRRGAAALLELIRLMESGVDIAITPDGPRGPCYTLHPGALMLARKTGAKVMPLRIRYSSFWQLKSWDRFQIPKPFSRVDVTILPLITVPESLDAEAFQIERTRIEAVLKEGHE